MLRLRAVSLLRMRGHFFWPTPDEVDRMGSHAHTPPGVGTRVKLAAVLGAVAFLVLVPVQGQAAHLVPGVVTPIAVGDGPGGVGVNPTTNRIYVANSGSNTVSVIDGSTNTVLTTIPVGGGPADVGVDDVTNRIYVVNDSSQTVSVIDGNPGSPTENSVIATIPLPSRVYAGGRGIALNPVTHRIYVPSFDPGGAVVVIDIAPGSPTENSVIATLGVATNAFAAAVNPTTNRIYVGHGSFFGRTQLTVINGATNAVSDGPAVGKAQSGIGVDPTTNRIYVYKGDPSRGEPFGLVVLDGSTVPETVVTTIPVGAGTFGGGSVGVNATTHRVYVVGNETSAVSVVDVAVGSPTENTIVATVPVSAQPSGIGVNPATDRVFAALPSLDLVAVIGNETMAPTITLTTPPEGAVYNQHQVVNADYSCADEVGGSGLASCVGDVPSGSAIGTAILGAHTFTVTATDNAGNTSSVTHHYTVVDVTAPTITLTTPPEGAVYMLNQVVNADYGCQDEAGGSGLASCVGNVASGTPIDTATVGAKTFTVTAADNASNTSSVTHHYSVIYNFSDFLAPVNNPNTVNTGKAGRTYPVKWQLTDANGNFISALSAVVGVVVKSTSCGDFTSDPADALETSTTGGTSLRYDSTANQYVYNWATPVKGCYTLFLKLDSGQVFPAFFQLS